MTGTARCERPRVIVVGGGFAGINAAHALARSEADVILVDRHNYHTFQPLLYQVSTGYLPPEEVGAALRSVFRRQANLTVRVAVVVSVDWKDRRLSLQDDTALDFDYLVLAAGAETNYFGIVGMAEHAWPLYTLADAVALRAHLLGTLEQVAPTGRPADAEITTVVVGGGPTGVETAGALASMAHEVVGPVATLRVVLVEAGPRLLSAFNPRSSERALQDLRRRSVDVRLRRTVQAADAGGVTLDGGERIQSSTVIWAAGVQANGLGRTLGLDLSRGRVVVDPYLQVPDHPNVFVAGDLAAVAAPHPGALLPMLAPVAIQAGRHAGEEVARLVAGEPLARFRYHDKGMMAVLGRGDAVAELPLLLGAGTSRRYRLRFGGLPAWLLWVGVHIAYLICFSNRVKVLVDWGWSYFTSRGAGAILVRLPAEPQVLGLPPDGAGGRIDATSSSNGGDGQRDPSMKRPGHEDNPTDRRPGPSLYPLRFGPIYEYRPWGGRELAGLLTKPLPGDGPVGEAWVLSDRPDHQSRVSDGPFNGWGLAELLEQFPEQMLGALAPRSGRFPLLLKFLDARDLLSVQVHPSDRQTTYLPAGDTGKTEAWVVLEVGPGSRVYAGLRPGATRDSLRGPPGNRALADHLACFAPKPGDAIFLPAGTVHSLGGGAVVFEVSKNSDVTFRLCDWDHVDAKTGQRRALQVEQAIACTDFAQGALGPVVPVVEATTPVVRERLFECEHLRLWRSTGRSPFSVGAAGVARVLVCTDGAGQVAHGDGTYGVGRGDVMLLPAVVGACPFRPNGSVSLLEVALPEVTVKRPSEGP